MKKTQLILPVLGALLIAAFAVAQNPESKTNDPLVMVKYTRLATSLSGQTNELNEFTDVMNAMDLLNNEADVGIHVSVLNALRSRQTDKAIRLLEIELDGEVAAMGYSSTNDRDANFNAVLLMAKKYRDRYPEAKQSPEIANAVKQAFNQLPH